MCIFVLVRGRSLIFHSMPYRTWDSSHTHKEVRILCMCANNSYVKDFVFLVFQVQRNIYQLNLLPLPLWPRRRIFHSSSIYASIEIHIKLNLFNRFFFQARLLSSSKRRNSNDVLRFELIVNIYWNLRWRGSYFSKENVVCY